MGKFESDARAETDAAVVETLAASQADLGVAIAAQQPPVAPELLSPGLRIMVKGFKQAVVFSGTTAARRKSRLVRCG